MECCDQWCRNEFESRGERGGGTRPAEIFLSCPFTFWLYKYNQSFLMSVLVMVSTVWLVSYLLFFYSLCLRAQPFVKVWVGARAPVPHGVVATDFNRTKWWRRCVDGRVQCACEDVDQVHEWAASGHQSWSQEDLSEYHARLAGREQSGCLETDALLCLLPAHCRSGMLQFRSLNWVSVVACYIVWSDQIKTFFELRITGSSKNVG